MGLLRRYPLGFGMLWCAGGPVGDVRTWDESLRKTILETTGLKRLYLRFRCDRERNVADTLFLSHRGWSRSISPMTSSFSMKLDLTGGDDELFGNLKRRWRRNLRVAAQNNLTIKICADPNVEEIARVYAAMETRKNLPPQFSREKLENLFKYAGSNLIFYRCEDESGNLISFRGCLAAGSNNAFTLTAAAPAMSEAPTGTTATTPAGTKVTKTITYTLTGGTPDALKPHVGHTVAITGVEAAPQMTTGTRDTSKGASPQGTSGSGASAAAKPNVETTAQTQLVVRQLSVNAVKMVSATCSLAK
jgi:hypothetical protein